MTTETENSAMARTYGAAGLAVFPCWWIADGRCACRRPDCGSPGKHPIIAPAHPKDSPERATCKGECGRAGHGLYDATTDADVIADWWTRWPLAHPGMPADRNGFAVLDVDPKNGGDESLSRLREYLDSKGEPLPETLTQITGSGGRHFVFAAPEGGVKGGANVFGADMPGLDTRGRGGYIIVAPSGHATGGRYEWVDLLGVDPARWPAILTELMEPPKPTPLAEYRRSSKAPSDRYAAQALDREIDILRRTLEGGRNGQLNTSAFNLGQLVAAGLLDAMVVRRELYAAATSIGLTERESAATILSGMRAGAASPRVGRAA